MSFSLSENLVPPTHLLHHRIIFSPSPSPLSTTCHVCYVQLVTGDDSCSNNTLHPRGAAACLTCLRCCKAHHVTPASSRHITSPWRLGGEKTSPVTASARTPAKKNQGDTVNVSSLNPSHRNRRCPKPCFSFIQAVTSGGRREGGAGADAHGASLRLCDEMQSLSQFLVRSHADQMDLKFMRPAPWALVWPRPINSPSPRTNKPYHGRPEPGRKPKRGNRKRKKKRKWKEKKKYSCNALHSTAPHRNAPITTAKNLAARDNGVITVLQQHPMVNATQLNTSACPLQKMNR